MNYSIILVLNIGVSSDHHITDDELDSVQWDLESMLTSVIVRRNTVREELNTFASMQFVRSLHRTAKNPKFPTIVSLLT